MAYAILELHAKNDDVVVSDVKVMSCTTVAVMYVVN